MFVVDLFARRGRSWHCLDQSLLVPRLLKNTHPRVTFTTTTPSNSLRTNTHQTQPLATIPVLDPRRRENSWIEVDVGFLKGANTHWQPYTRPGKQWYKDNVVPGGVDVNKLLVKIVQNKCAGGKTTSHLGPFVDALAQADAWAPTASGMHNHDADRLQGGGGVLRPGFKDRTLLLHAFMLPICSMLPEKLTTTHVFHKRDSAEHLSLQLQRCILSTINDQSIRRELLLSKDKLGMTPLIAASGSLYLKSLLEYVQAVETLKPPLTVDEKTAWLRATTIDGCTALDSSFISGGFRSTKWLMHAYKTALQDSDRWLMYTQCNERGATSLHQAMWFAHPHAVKELLVDMKLTAPSSEEFLIALTKPTKHGHTPLLLALVRNDPDVLSAFVEVVCTSTSTAVSLTSNENEVDKENLEWLWQPLTLNAHVVDRESIEWLWQTFKQLLLADDIDINKHKDDTQINNNDAENDHTDHNNNKNKGDDDGDHGDDYGDGADTQSVVVEGLHMAAQHSFEFKRADHQNDSQLIGKLLLVIARQYRNSAVSQTSLTPDSTKLIPAPTTTDNQAVRDGFSFFPGFTTVEAPKEARYGEGAHWDSVLLSSVVEVQHPPFLLSFVDMMKEIKKQTLDRSDPNQTLYALELDSSISIPFLRAVLEGDVQSASELLESFVKDTQRKYMEYVISDHKLLPSSPQVQLLEWIQRNAIESGVNNDKVLDWLLEGRLLNDILQVGDESDIEKCFNLLRVSPTKTKPKTKSKTKPKPKKKSRVRFSSSSGRTLHFALHHCARFQSVGPFMTVIEALRESHRSGSKEFYIMLTALLPYEDGRGGLLKEMITSATADGRVNYENTASTFQQQMTALLGKNQPNSLADIIDPQLSHEMLFMQCKKGLSSLDYAIDKLCSKDLETYLEILSEHARDWTTQQLQFVLLHRDKYKRITPIQRLFQRKLETSTACINLMSRLVDDAEFDKEQFYQLSVPYAASSITPLHDAARSGNTHMFTWFLSLVKRADLTSEQFQTWFSARTNTQHTALHQVLHSGKPALVTEYLRVLHNAPILDKQTYFELLSGETSHGYTPIHTAVRAGNPVSLQILIDELLQADLTEDQLRDTMTWASKDGSTPLHLCFIHGDAAILEVYTSALQTVGLTKEDYHSLLTATNVNEQNLLHLALQQENADMLTALLGAVRDSVLSQDLLKDFLTARDIHGQTPLHLACSKSWDLQLVTSLTSAIHGFGDAVLAEALRAETKFGKVPMRDVNQPFCDQINSFLYHKKSSLDFF
eukprot:m.15613 g.15613  ORF g.15613 m.15613 type:complete len:1269 (+) comp10660_c1_seq1:142-3948(+)